MSTPSHPPRNHAARLAPNAGALGALIPHMYPIAAPSQVQIRDSHYEALRTAQLDDKHASKRPVLKQNTTRPLSSPPLGGHGDRKWPI